MIRKIHSFRKGIKFELYFFFLQERKEIRVVKCILTGKEGDSSRKNYSHKKRKEIRVVKCILTEKEGNSSRKMYSHKKGREFEL